MSMVRAYPGVHVSAVQDRAARDCLKAIDVYLRDSSRAVQAPTGGTSTGSNPTDASYVTISAEGSLTNERRLIGSSPVTVTDGGAGSTVTIAAATVVVGPASATANAIVRFNGTTGKLVQDYTSGAPTVGDTGVVAISAGLTLTGAATNTSSYSVSTNALNFLSAVPDTAGNYAFDFQDTLGSATTGARTGTSYLLGLRDRTGQYRFRLTEGAKAGAATKLIVGGSTQTSTMSSAAWTFGDNSTGTSADPGLKLSSISTGNVFSCGDGHGLAFYASTNLTGSPLGIIFDSDFQDTAGLLSSDNQIIFRKTQSDDTVTIPKSIAFRFQRNETYGDARRHTTFENGLLNETSLPADGAFSGITQALRFVTSHVNFGLYKSAGGRWLKVDGINGGGFKFTDAGTTEPTT